MAKLKVEQFVDLVKRSGLVDNEQLDQALSGVDRSVNDSGIVASSLTKAGLLTEWQTEKLLQGRHKGFYLGKYKLLNHIGTGGMGSVYLAEHQVMRHRVAIKLLSNHLASQPSYLERFHQEARAAAALAHPNIIRAFDVDQHESFHYLVMEFVDGTDLQAVVSRAGPLAYDTCANYTRQAAEGLAYAHRMGLIHRDVKPANLLVDKEGTVKILDMGLARFSDESQGSLTMAYDQKMIGTVDYLAPEQALDSHKVDARADVYSLGCTLYFMLSGDAPFPQGTISQRLLQHQSGEPTDIREHRADAPEELIAICKKMMAKSLDDRYQSADEVAEDLAAFLGEGAAGGSGISDRTYVPPPTGPSKNENLTLAPLEDEANGRGKSASPSKTSDSQAGKSGAKRKPPSSVASSETKTKRGDSSVAGGKKSGSGVKSSAGVKTPKVPDLSQGDDLMDELLSAKSLPPTKQLSTTPLAPAHKPEHDNKLVSRVGWMVGAVVIGTVVLLGLLFGLMGLSDYL